MSLNPVFKFNSLTLRDDVTNTLYVDSFGPLSTYTDSSGATGVISNSYPITSYFGDTYREYQGIYSITTKEHSGVCIMSFPSEDAITDGYIPLFRFTDRLSLRSFYCYFTRTHSSGTVLELNWAAGVFIGDLNISYPLTTTKYYFSWAMSRENSGNARLKLYLNGVELFNNTFAYPDINVSIKYISPFGAATSPDYSAVSRVIYDLILFDNNFTTSYLSFISTPAGYTELKKQIKSGPPSLFKRKSLLAALSQSTPNTSVPLTGLRATFDYNNRLVRYPRTIDFELTK